MTVRVAHERLLLKWPEQESIQVLQMRPSSKKRWLDGGESVSLFKVVKTL